MPAIKKSYIAKLHWVQIVILKKHCSERTPSPVVLETKANALVVVLQLTDNICSYYQALFLSTKQRHTMLPPIPTLSVAHVETARETNNANSCPVLRVPCWGLVGKPNGTHAFWGTH